MTAESVIRATPITTCRCCGNGNMANFMTLEKMPMPDGHLKLGEKVDKFISDLDILWCPVCTLVQAGHDLDLSNYYEDYDYTVSSSTSINYFMNAFAGETARRFDLKSQDLVIEVGSGDGALLSCFKNFNFQVLGVEPAEGLVQAARSKGIETIKGLFEVKNILSQLKKDQKAQVVVSQYTFDHIPTPVKFLEDVKKILDPKRGVLIIEVHDFEKILRRNEACLFTHEHPVYMTAGSFEYLFKHNGFKLISAELMPESLSRGNSIVVAAALDGSCWPAIEVPLTPISRSLGNLATFKKFSSDVQSSHRRLKEYVARRLKEGKVLIGYGAAARGVNTLVLAKLTKKEIPYFCDKNPTLQGKRMPATHIPVKAPEAILNDDVDEVIVFNYGYMREIERELAPFVENGGKLTSLLELIK